MEPDPINPEIRYDGFGEPSPVTTCGSFRNLTFAFYARWDDWRFVLSTDPDVDAVVFEHDFDTTREHLEQGEHRLPDRVLRALDSAFMRQGTYGETGTWSASYMPRDEVQRIVRACISEYEMASPSR